ncbi:sensor histidine kinase [Glaciihabitans sp. INWT7]|uniref:sensor histidine kinase n=1 Tax=Glaciihabitans sp. INWT7 TaxID=2596912 RepID=UPI0021023E51|nr:sensor histidine kinase [Glaciihabitans sp. INWT7]
MPFHGRFDSAGWTERRSGRFADRNFESWHEPWQEMEASRARRQNSAGARRMRLILPVLLSLFVQVPAVFFSVRPGNGIVRTAVWTDPRMLLVGLGLALIGPLALLAARRFPGPVVAIAAAAGGADLLLFRTSDHPPYLALAFAVVSAVVRGARSWAWISVSAAWLLALAVSLIAGLDVSPPRIAAVTLGILIVLGVGESVRTRREQYSEISRRIAERKQSEVQAERVRIARELHDVLAHSLSQINVQAGVGLHLMDKQPEKAKAALASIKESSKTALDEVRSVLGILRAEGGADPSAPLVPEPDLSRLGGLAASIADQGVAVEVRNTIESVPSAGTQLALYRIAQESLTNVLRHARATSVTVSAREEDGFYLLEIIDDGTGSPPRQDTGGRGLLGMHERAELLGGSLTAAPAEGGGFRVSARIPQTAAAVSYTSAPDIPSAPRGGPSQKDSP